MFESALLTEFAQCLIVAFFLIPLCQTLSLHAIQIYVIIRHGLPLSGIKWILLMPNMVTTYLKFLFKWKGQKISCKLENNKGGFEWSGTFRWKVW